MATPHYIVQKIGDQYVTVPADPYPQMTKLAYTVWGSLVALHGFRRRSLMGLAMAGYGSWMAYAAMRGQSQSLGHLFKKLSAGRAESHDAPSYPHDHRNKSTQAPQDHIDEAAMESFPASDPPARTASTAAR